MLKLENEWMYEMLFKNGEKGGSLVRSTSLGIRRRIRNGMERGLSHLYLYNESARHILWICKERGKWRTDVLCEKGLDMNEELACRTVIKCVTKTQVIN
jgi:hypothetical protein